MFLEYPNKKSIDDVLSKEYTNSFNITNGKNEENQIIFLK